jgi:uncharacterized protein YgiM (DUF1202 family)
LDNITAGDHTILFSSPGFIDKTVRAKAIAGYRLTISVQLAKAPTPALPSPEATPSATPSISLTPTPKLTPIKTPTPTKAATSSAALAKPYVQILETPTGYLRVRSTPAGDEVGKVYPGETHKYFETSTPPTEGWYKIEYQPGAEGWVSNQYAKLIQ